MIANIFCNEIIKIGKRGRGRHIAIDFKTSSSWPTHSVNWQTAVVSLYKKDRFTWWVICFGWTQVVVWALSVVFVKEPFLWHAGLVNCIQWDALCSALPCQLRILVSPTNEPLSPPFLTLSLFSFCFYKLTPLTHVRILVLSLEAH